MTYSDLISGLYLNNLSSVRPAESSPQQSINNTPVQPAIGLKETPILIQPINNDQPTIFSVDRFKAKLKEKVSNKNKNYQEYSSTINAYDVFSCARIPYFRIKSYPVPDYSSSYLPVELRCQLGTACHEFLQEVDGIFTETEVCLKHPDLKISARLDALINHNVLVEIKSCGFNDYEKILKSNTPRVHDFWQTIFYKYMLENHLEIMKKQAPTRSGSAPALDFYNIDTIQLVYVCHELIAAEANTIGESVERAKILKRQLESKKNPFWFIKTLTIDLNKVNVEPYINHIKEKLAFILNSLETNTIPPLDSKFIDKKDCYFCLYNKICNNH
jgi:hypothetical protein